MNTYILRIVIPPIDDEWYMLPPAEQGWGSIEFIVHPPTGRLPVMPGQLRLNVTEPLEVTLRAYREIYAPEPGECRIEIIADILDSYTDTARKLLDPTELRTWLESVPFLESLPTQGISQ